MDQELLLLLLPLPLLRHLLLRLNLRLHLRMIFLLKMMNLGLVPLLHLILKQMISICYENHIYVLGSLRNINPLLFDFK